MLKTFHVNYKTGAGDGVLIQIRKSADAPIESFTMTDEGDGERSFACDRGEFFYYRYVVSMADGLIEERHWRFSVKLSKPVDIYDTWRSPQDGDDALHAAAFSRAVFSPDAAGVFPPAPKPGSIVFVLTEPRVARDEEIRVVSKQFVNWESSQAFKMMRCDGNTWVLDMGAIPFMKEIEFKFCIWDTVNDCFKRYEDGGNRIVRPTHGKTEVHVFNGFNYGTPWRAAGVAVPVFSLRSRNGRGCGEFADLKPLADWCNAAHLKVIQLLPINDTTAIRQWRDSYPYNAISIMALHPSYISVDEVYAYYGRRMSAMERENGLYLNDSTFLDYNRTRDWKDRNLRYVFTEEFDNVVKDKAVVAYLEKNKSWLKDYAAFATLRDKYKTPNFRLWPQMSKHSSADVDKMFEPSNPLFTEVMYRVFIQFHVEKQLRDAIDYVHSKGVAVKGDLPIGVNPHSVEAWTEPELFDFGMQAGAPPDFFSHDGQNWGFPTYRWDVMKKDGFAWWGRRMQRMQMFFDVFRIDHILGFFRIWSIPYPFHSGLMGVFSPSLPLSSQELAARGVTSNPADLAWPIVSEQFLRAQFSEFADSAMQFFVRQTDGRLRLKEGFFDPQKFDKWVEKDIHQTARDRVRSAISNTLHEVLFVSVTPGEWQPRIMLEETDRFKALSDSERGAIKAIYDDFFFCRHNDFWKRSAEEHLDALLGKCDMLVCGEDLGMIPASVPIVMQRKQILSLELQRMPKENWQRFGSPAYFPYLSVCATSSHDISGIRGWWEEDRADVDWFYHNMMGRSGATPGVAGQDIVSDVIEQNLKSPSMLCINPIQDYAGMLDNVPHLLPFEERINVPSNADQHWKYRIPFCIDELGDKYPELARKVAAAVDASGRQS